MDSTSLLHETKISVRDTTEDVDTCAYYGTIVRARRRGPPVGRPGPSLASGCWKIAVAAPLATVLVAPSRGGLSLAQNAYNYAMRSIRSLGITDREDKPIVLLSLLWGNSYDLGTNMLFGLLDLILRFPVLLLSLAVTINSIVHMANDGNFFDGDHQYQIVLGLFALTLLHGHFYYVIRRNQQVRPSGQGSVGGRSRGHEEEDKEEEKVGGHGSGRGGGRGGQVACDFASHAGVVVGCTRVDQRRLGGDGVLEPLPEHHRRERGDLERALRRRAASAPRADAGAPLRDGEGYAVQLQLEELVLHQAAVRFGPGRRVGMGRWQERTHLGRRTLLPFSCVAQPRRNWLFTVFWWYLAALIISIVDLFFVYL